MLKQITLFFLSLFFISYTFAQGKTLIGIVPFKSSSQSDSYSSSGYKTAIQDAVAEALQKSKRFSLVEREKMDQLKSEKDLQKDEDFLDGKVIEQSKSLGAQYIVLGNISRAKTDEKQTSVPYAGIIVTYNSEISFSIRIVDVATGEIIASNSFSKSAKGKNSFDDALKDIKPDIEKFIRENFKLVASLVSIEEKSSTGDAVKVLISAGSSANAKENSEYKVFELSEISVDGKNLTRKKTIGKIVVTKVEDENFSICTVKEGGAEISKKIDAGNKIKCELISN